MQACVKRILKNVRVNVGFVGCIIKHHMEKEEVDLLKLFKMQTYPVQKSEMGKRRSHLHTIDPDYSKKLASKKICLPHCISVRDRLNITVMFRTRQKSVLLLTIKNPGTSWRRQVAVELKSSRVQVLVTQGQNISFAVTNPVHVADNRWHNVTICRSHDVLGIIVDNIPERVFFNKTLFANHFGINRLKGSKVWGSIRTFGASMKQFSGCIQSVVMNNIPISPKDVISDLPACKSS